MVFSAVISKKRLVEILRSILLRIVNFPIPNRSVFGFKGRKFAGYIFYQLTNFKRRLKYQSNLDYSNLSNYDNQICLSLDQNGYYISKESESEVRSRIISECSEIVLQSENIIRKEKSNTNKSFMYNAIKITGRKTPKVLTDFALDNKYIEGILKYLGENPRLVSIKILVSNPTKDFERTKSQLFHLDDQAEKMVKLIIPITSIDIDSGPFTYIPKKETKRLARKLSYGMPLGDSNISVTNEKKCKLKDYEIGFLGDRSNTLLIDTSKCFHKGSIDIRRQRVVIIISYNGGARTTLIKETISKNIRPD